MEYLEVRWAANSPRPISIRQSKWDRCPPDVNPTFQFDRTRFRKLAALLGILILAVFAIIQAVHFHPLEQTDLHCSICLAMHAVVAIIALPALAVLLTIQTQVSPVKRLLHYITHSTSIFIRPPPTTA